MSKPRFLANLSPFLLLLTQENIGLSVSMESEIKCVVDLAGLSQPLKFFLTEHVSKVVTMLFFPHKTWFLVIDVIMVAKEVLFNMPGTTLKMTVLFLITAILIVLEPVNQVYAQRHVLLLEVNGKNTELEMPTPSQALVLLNKKFIPMVQCKLVSMSMKTSCTIKVVFIYGMELEDK